MDKLLGRALTGLIRQVIPKGKAQQDAERMNKGQQPRSRAPVARRPQAPKAKKQRSMATVSAPVARTAMVRANKPKFSGSSSGIRVSHRELITSITSSGTDWNQVAALDINPGDSHSFPWLSVIAQNWENYKFNRLRFVFEPQVGSNTNGLLSMAPDYDAADAAPNSELTFSSYSDYVDGPIWHELIGSVNPQSMHLFSPWRYVRTGAKDLLDQPITYDVGTQYIYAVGVSAGIVGRLYVEYDVEFKIPTLPPNGTDVLSGAASGVAISTTYFLGATPIFTGSAILSYNPSTARLYLNPGNYILTMVVQGVGLTTIISGAGANVTITDSVYTVNAAGTQGTWQGFCRVTLGANNYLAPTSNVVATASALHLASYTA